MNVLDLSYKARVVIYQLLKVGSAIVAALFVIAPALGWNLPDTRLDSIDQVIIALTSLLGFGAGEVATSHARIAVDGPQDDPRPAGDPTVTSVVVSAANTAATAAQVAEDVVRRLEQLGTPKAP